MPHVCPPHVHCVRSSMQIRPSNTFEFVHVLVSVHAHARTCVCGCVRTGAIKEHPDVSAASLGVCHWDNGVGLRWPVLNIDSVTTTCPTQLIKAICIKFLPSPFLVSLSLFFFFFPSSSLETGSAHTRLVVPLSRPLKSKKMSCWRFSFQRGKTQQ